MHGFGYVVMRISKSSPVLHPKHTPNNIENRTSKMQPPNFVTFLSGGSWIVLVGEGIGWLMETRV